MTDAGDLLVASPAWRANRARDGRRDAHDGAGRRVAGARGLS
jgi:hypothetical protein